MKALAQQPAHIGFVQIGMLTIPTYTYGAVTPHLLADIHTLAHGSQWNCICTCKALIMKAEAIHALSRVLA